MLRTLRAHRPVERCLTPISRFGQVLEVLSSEARPAHRDGDESGEVALRVLRAMLTTRVRDVHTSSHTLLARHCPSYCNKDVVLSLSCSASVKFFRKVFGLLTLVYRLVSLK